MNQDNMLLGSVISSQEKRGTLIKPLFCQVIKNRAIVLNRNALVLIVGEPGTGKSYAALRMAEVIDPKFGIDRVAFTTEEFLTILREGIDQKKFEKGSAILYDEVGISHSNRNFYDSVNKALNFVFQGFRRENLIVFMTVPKMAFVDIQVRNLMNFLIVPKKIYQKERICKCRGYVIEQNSLLFGENFFLKKATVASAKLDGVREMDSFGLFMPNEELRIRYEQKKKLFMNDLYDKALALAKSVNTKRLQDIGLSKEQSENGVVDSR